MGFQLIGMRAHQQWFTDIASFEKFVSKLPRSSKLIWNSGCWRLGEMPLTGKRTTIQEFGEFCRSCGVEFEYTYGY